MQSDDFVIKFPLSERFEDITKFKSNLKQYTHSNMTQFVIQLNQSKLVKQQWMKRGGFVDFKNGLKCILILRTLRKIKFSIIILLHTQTRIL